MSLGIKNANATFVLPGMKYKVKSMWHVCDYISILFVNQVFKFEVLTKTVNKTTTLVVAKSYVFNVQPVWYISDKYRTEQKVISI